ncbi:hypothetical protein Psal182_03581 (plasmid) [Piscirickettsia salmonis]|nr:hypothetical protein Psal182_03581 [Piscirickettsia salmonis]
MDGAVDFASAAGLFVKAFELNKRRLSTLNRFTLVSDGNVSHKENTSKEDLYILSESNEFTAIKNNNEIYNGYIWDFVSLYSGLSNFPEALLSLKEGRASAY